MSANLQEKFQFVLKMLPYDPHVDLFCKTVFGSNVPSLKYVKPHFGFPDG